MEEKEVITTIREFISKQFPKECNCCGKRYQSFREYLQNTTHAGKPISYDAEYEDWNPVKPIGSISISNCTCGSSLAISSMGMNLFTLGRLMNWARIEAKKRGVAISDILEDIRNKIDISVLQD